MGSKIKLVFVALAMLMLANAEAASPNAVKDKCLAAVNTPVTIYPLANDYDPDESDVLSIDSFDSVSTEGGTITDNGDGSLRYTPATGFAGFDIFSYMVSDGNGGFDSARVKIDVNATYNAEAARNDILSGVSSLGDPSGPGRMVAYGPTAYNIGNYGDSTDGSAMIATSTLGSGRIIAMPDHQWLRMNSLADQGDTGQYYLNAVEWLSGTTSKNIKIVTTNIDSNNSDVWLAAQGFTNVVKSNNYAVELADADVLIGWLGSSLDQSDIDAIIAFVRGGGGLFVSDYGVGYSMWWHKEIPDIPSNIILRHAGMSFTGGSTGGSLTVDRASGQITSEVVIDMLEDSSGYSSAEMEEGGTVLGRLFECLPEGDNLLARLDEKFYERINTINPSPSSRVSDAFDKALLRRESALLLEVPVEEITKHRTAEMVYGIVPDEAPRVTQVFSFDVAAAGKNTLGDPASIWLSTGLYAAPGEIITVTVDAGVTNLGMKVKLSGDWNNISGRDYYLRMPFGTSREYDIDSTSVQAANPFGGLVYITIPKYAVPGAFDVTIENAVEAPYFVLGQDTNEDWLNTLRDRPAPWAELVSGNMIISVPTYQISDLVKAEELMTFWHEGVAAQDDLGCWTGRRNRPSRIYSMIQTAWGGGYAGYPIGAWGWDCGDYDALEAGNCWGHYHETGHLHQSGYWTDGRTGEVTVNIFSMCAIEAVCDSGRASGGWGTQWDPAARVSKYQSGGGFDAADLSERLAMYSMLKVAFGWDSFKNTFQAYLDDKVSSPGSLPDNDQEEWDQFMQRFSREVGYDLSPFFVDWEYGVSTGAINSLSDLDEWNMVELIEESYIIAIEGESVLISNPAANDYSFDGTVILDSIGSPAHGTLTSNGNGTYTYAADAGYRGPDSISYTVRNGYGNTFTGEIVIIAGQGALMETFTGISGSAVSDLTGSAKYPDSPDEVTIVTDFEAPSDRLDNYGVRMLAWLMPPTTGDYTFWIASDDNSELRLSGDADPDNTSLIASVPSYTSSRQWSKYAEQESATIYMVAGQSYYIEALMKEGGGGDNLAVAWQGPGFSQQVIANTYITPYYIEPVIFTGDTFVRTSAFEGFGYADVLADTVIEGSNVSFMCLAGPLWLEVAADGTLSGVAGNCDVGLNSFTIRATDIEGSWFDDVNIDITVHDTFTGELGLVDFAGFAGHWLDSGCVDVPACGGADLTGDGAVDTADLQRFAWLWLADYGSDGLAGHWTFDADGSDAAGDNDGALVGDAVVSSGAIVGGGALSLDGDGDYVEMAGFTGVAGGTARTVSAWVKTTAVDGEIVTWGDLGFAGGSWIMRTNFAGLLRIEVGSGKIVGTTAVNDGQWHHVAAVLVDDGTPNVSEIQLYVDGQLEVLTVQGNRVIDTGSALPVRVGICVEQGGDRYFDGLIDDVRVYERAMTAGEVLKLFNN